VIGAAAFAAALQAERAAMIDGRISPAPDPGEPHELVVILNGQRFPVEIALSTPEDGEGAAAELWMPSLADGPQSLRTGWTPGRGLFEGELAGEAFALFINPGTGGIAMRHRGFAATALACTPRTAELHARLPEKEAADTARLVTSPMPGLVVSVSVEAGQSVEAGAALLVVEAMKMENVIRAEISGVIKTVAAEPGASVAADELLVEFE